MNKYMERNGKKFTFSHRLSLKLYALKTNLKRQKRRFRKMINKAS